MRIRPIWKISPVFDVFVSFSFADRGVSSSPQRSQDYVYTQKPGVLVRPLQLNNPGSETHNCTYRKETLYKLVIHCVHNFSQQYFYSG